MVRDHRLSRQGAPNPGPFGTHEEKELVLLDRAAHGSAKLVPRVDRPFDAASVIRIIVRPVSREPVNLVCRTVEGVAARLGGNIHDSGGGPAILGREIVRQDAKFLYGFQRNRLPECTHEFVVVCRSV